MQTHQVTLDETNRAVFDERARVFKALAHPTRLFLLERLAECEHCVCQLRDMVGSDISTVSKHLSVLRSAGIVGVERRGQQMWYRLKMPCVLNFFTCIESVLRQDAAARLKVIGR